MSLKSFNDGSNSFSSWGRAVVTKHAYLDTHHSGDNRSCFCSQQAEVDRNIELLKKKDEELSEALEKMENQTENNDIDDIIVPTAPLYKQILNLYAEENAIEDTIFYLGEALRRGVIDLEVFLKVREHTLINV